MFLLNNRNSAQKIISTFWLIAKLLSFKLWTSERLFPLVPSHSIFQNTHYIVHVACFIISISILMLCVFFKPSKWLLLILLFTEVFSCMMDITRWQPWEFQYLSMLYVSIICVNDYQKCKQWFALIVVSIYIYSGLHKFNFHFINNMWIETILKDFLRITASSIQQYKLAKLGFTLPIVETLAGIGLLSKFWQKKAAYVLITMHVCILVILGPLGINYNQIVWPWNMAMIGLLYVLFIKNKTSILNFNIILLPSLYIIALLWLVMPIFSFWEKWPHYLSNDLYSGKAMGMQVLIQSKDSNNPLVKYSNVNSKKDSAISITVQHWAITELNTPQFPEWFYYKKIAEILKKRYGNNISFSLYNTPKKDSLNKILNK
ncbi:MAG: hypothetical protein ACOVMM_07970 [Chitinophagaceae bacterium]